ncbi:MAG: GNAT family N-acetyltransferase [Chloroflexota bacterium]|nr:GNAT family N-acetyltransferase [Chloroflexota bacterium]
MVTTLPAQPKTTRDGRPFTVRHARPSDARPLARLFAAVRSEGRWMATPPDARSDPREAYYLGEMIRAGVSLVVVAEADGAVVGNVMVTREPGGMQDHLGVLSICVDRAWRDNGLGGALIEAALAWSRVNGLQKVALSVFSDNDRAVAVYERAGFVHEGVRRMQFRAPGGGFRDELLMAWFSPAPAPIADEAPS